MTKKELQDFLKASPQETDLCTRCQTELPEELLTDGLCDSCEGDMNISWNTAFINNRLEA